MAARLYIVIIWVVSYFLFKAHADIYCNVTNNCTDSVYLCDAGKSCYISCIGESVCKGAVFNCPDDFECVINVNGNNALYSGIVHGGTRGNLTLDCEGGPQTCAWMTINCPSYGICDIYSFFGYQMFVSTQINASMNTKVLYIHGGGSYVLQNAHIFCPKDIQSGSSQNKCIIQLD
eukprot:164491_1